MWCCPTPRFFGSGSHSQNVQIVHKRWCSLHHTHMFRDPDWTPFIGPQVLHLSMLKIGLRLVHRMWSAIRYTHTHTYRQTQLILFIRYYYYYYNYNIHVYMSTINKFQFTIRQFGIYYILNSSDEHVLFVSRIWSQSKTSEMEVTEHSTLPLSLTLPMCRTLKHCSCFYSQPLVEARSNLLVLWAIQYIIDFNLKNILNSVFIHFITWLVEIWTMDTFHAQFHKLTHSCSRRNSNYGRAFHAGAISVDHYRVYCLFNAATTWIIMNDS